MPLSHSLRPFLLSGCNSEPSEQDIYTAMNKVVEQTNAIVKSIAGKDVPKDALRELKSVKKHDCVEVSDKSYKCNVTAVVDNEKRTAAVTLSKRMMAGRSLISKPTLKPSRQAGRQLGGSCLFNTRL
jgi:hypothetical protein